MEETIETMRMAAGVMLKLSMVLTKDMANRILSTQSNHNRHDIHDKRKSCNQDYRFKNLSRFSEPREARFVPDCHAPVMDVVVNPLMLF